MDQLSWSFFYRTFLPFLEISNNSTGISLHPTYITYRRKGGIQMNLVALYLACIIAGFTLTRLPNLPFLASLGNLFDIIGVLTMLVFSLVLIYMGVKALIKK
jgi:hypothetical protein